MWENIVKPGSHRWQYGACALYHGYQRLQTHFQNVYYSLLLHCNDGWTKALARYVIRTLFVLLQF